jgi:hypothetical protein
MDSEEITFLVTGVACLASAVALSFGEAAVWVLLFGITAFFLLTPLIIVSLLGMVIRVAESAEQKSTSPDQEEE